MTRPLFMIFAAVCAPFCAAATLSAQSADDKTSDPKPLVSQLHNPVAALTSIPIGNDWDTGSGPLHTLTDTLTIKPVVPFTLTENWNLITRTIVPFLYAASSVTGGDGETGLGDITATVYLSPDKPMRGWFWGVGPALILPTSTRSELGTGRWSAGPTFALLRQDGGWTVGAITGHAWAFAGDRRRDFFDTTFLQPFFSYSTAHDTTFGMDTTSSYDWTARQSTVPVETNLSQIVHAAGQDIELGLTGRYYARRAVGGPQWGISVSATFTVAKKP